MDTKKDTSWQQVAPWYNKLVGVEGHYYHQHVVIPGLLRLLELQADSSLVDIGCGQGILSRAIPEVTRYLGLDKAGALIAAARSETQNPNYTFQVADVTKQVAAPSERFSHAVIVLALQNMEAPAGALRTAAEHLNPGGKLVIVLNHPHFRIPRQSGWGVDEKTKQQYRWVNRYASPLKVPIIMNPGQKKQQTTWSFHFSLQEYVAMLAKAGFVITNLEEWSSDKESKGSAAKMENRARREFPLFMTLVAQLKQ